ncbi:hypothetical protein MG068_11640 [Stenotrophomonas sp. ASS1]|nr:hypothetical protein MG068_11640 [Stenotrophomonas sp. ASS1]
MPGCRTPRPRFRCSGSSRPPSCRFEDGWFPAGLHPAPAVVPAAGRQPQEQRPKQQRAFRGTAGWVRLQGALQVRPCKLGRRIHAAHAPATGPTPPSTDFRDLPERHELHLVGVDLGRHVLAAKGSDPVAAQRALTPRLEDMACSIRCFMIRDWLQEGWPDGRPWAAVIAMTCAPGTV